MSAGPSNKPTAVLDTNLLVSGIIATGVPHQVVRAWQAGLFDLRTSPAMVAEARDVLNRPYVVTRRQVTQADVDDILTGLTIAQVQPLPDEALPVHCRDGQDDIVLAIALGATADYLVTGDADLHALADHTALSGLRIVTPAQFLAELPELT